MKAIQLNAFGVTHLSLEDIAPPQPEAHEVLVKVSAIALQFLDNQVIDGKILPDLTFPHIPGCEGAGVVDSVGKNVTRWKKGDRVLIPFIPRWEAGATSAWHNAIRVGLQAPGTLGECTVAPENTLVASPANWTDQQACTLPVIGLTAWSHLAFLAKVHPGQTILVQGTGSISLFALQLAKIIGLRIIATTSDDNNFEKLKALGASEVINYKKAGRLSDEVKRRNGGTGIDFTLDVGGSATLEQSIKSCREGGYVGMVGFLTGSELKVDSSLLIMNYVRLQGYSVGNSEQLRSLVTAIERSTFEPVIDQVFSLEQFRQAFDHLKNGKPFGRVVITM